MPDGCTTASVGTTDGLQAFSPLVLIRPPPPASIGSLSKHIQPNRMHPSSLSTSREEDCHNTRRCRLDRVVDVLQHVLHADDPSGVGS